MKLSSALLAIATMASGATAFATPTSSSSSSVTTSTTLLAERPKIANNV
eukprot:CAMPEP_0201715876 /NCGR_PEP_ID=MMETSP0593-20130828/1968_1 /ASSEMBLY_ACC=CAM_ASM_000672 /TAXON_ID=267983 /ORGANISM="Skeletonema japonicum, Strain CCMP2506" /LENGTH=48 /DNA_ID= /DNA_START= /DNA_END= /DNA_ORIENTATION=